MAGEKKNKPPRAKKPMSEIGRLTSINNASKALSTWNEDPHLKEIMTVARQMRRTKYGLYAGIPIICRGDECTYKVNCFLWKSGSAPVEHKCPLEIAAIEDLFERYCRDMNIDPDNEKHNVDVMMVKEIVDIDISIIRCDNKMAISADFIIESVVAMTEKGQPIYKQELHPLIEYKEKLRASKNKLLQLLNSTRKDKEGSKIHIELDPSERAAEMIRMQRELQAVDEETEKEKEMYLNKKKPEIIEVDPIGFE